MVAFTSVLVLATTFAATKVVGNPAGHIHELIARQSPINPSSFPAECREQCTPLINSFNNNCTDLPCLCGTTMADNLMVCWQCGASIVGVETAQTAYNSYAAACGAAGLSVPHFDAPSSSGGSSGSSGGSSGSSGGSSGSSGGSSGSSGGSSGSSGGSSGSTGSTGTGGASRAQVAGVGIIAAAATALLLAV